MKKDKNTETCKNKHARNPDIDTYFAFYPMDHHTLMERKARCLVRIRPMSPWHNWPVKMLWAPNLHVSGMTKPWKWQIWWLELEPSPVNLNWSKIIYDHLSTKVCNAMWFRSPKKGQSEQRRVSDAHSMHLRHKKKVKRNDLQYYSVIWPTFCT